MLFDGYLLLSDMDGTLAFSEENRDAIRYFQENGGLFTVATGRSPGFIRNYCEWFVPNTYTVCINGTVLYDDVNRQAIERIPLDTEAVMKTLSEILDHYPEIGCIEYVTGEPEDPFVPAEEVREDPTSVFRHKNYHPGLAWMKLLLCQDCDRNPEITEELNRTYGDAYRFEQSWPGGIEMFSAKAGKGTMMNRLRACCGKPIHTTVAAGDYGNDVQMLKMADIGYAVGNANELAKAAADRITIPFDQNAIAKIISDLEEEARLRQSGKNS